MLETLDKSIPTLLFVCYVLLQTILQMRRSSSRRNPARRCHNPTTQIDTHSTELLTMPLFNWLGPGEGESLRKLYSRALTLDEWATKGLWRHILSKAFPLEKGFLVLTEAPPIQAGSLRRVDLMVERSGEDNLCPIILWGEAKKANSLGFDMAEVESQGFTAGMEHLMYDRTGRTAVWVMTVGQGREEDVFLWPIFPANWDCGNKHTYLNVRGNEVVFEWLLEHIRQNQRPTEAYVKDFVHGRIPNILIDAQSAMQVDVLKVEQQGLVCRLFDGGSIKIFPNDWVPSFVRNGAVTGIGHGVRLQLSFRLCQRWTLYKYQVGEIRDGLNTRKMHNDSQ
ncbi:hypothetical protein CCM_05695 [Cordyceps militaris CM01]|uniref:Uncharacterized protein n=1 Tax=Cordyceps militaris (strain CM01) TaxID=983644 RepID=G3JGY1_CORMM|nr:uncharacterized protein CCM_05695 [Cordyceps militaris CM01]EGX91537.1 hypothetical protein CCM_05695 [Cordyceps militaris CM01]